MKVRLTQCIHKHANNVKINNYATPNKLPSSASGQKTTATAINSNKRTLKNLIHHLDTPHHLWYNILIKGDTTMSIKRTTITVKEIIIEKLDGPTNTWIPVSHKVKKPFLIEVFNNIFRPNIPDFTETIPQNKDE